MMHDVSPLSRASGFFDHLIQCLLRAVQGML
jgi:hypothetical protein